MEATIYAAIATGLFGLLGFFFTKYLERKSVSTALLAEIRRLLVVVVEHRGHWDRWIEEGVTERHPLFPFSCDVYKKHISNLGLVNSRYVGLVVQFYGYLNFINSLQKARQEYRESGDTEAFNNMYKAVLIRVEREFGQVFDTAFQQYGLASGSSGRQASPEIVDTKPPR
jgi:hypothetical protein